MHSVGFEPTPPKRIELESTALDHSAMNAIYIYYVYIKNMRRPGIEPGPRAWKARILTIELSTQ